MVQLFKVGEEPVQPGGAGPTRCVAVTRVNRLVVLRQAKTLADLRPGVTYILVGFGGGGCGGRVVVGKCEVEITGHEDEATSGKGSSVQSAELTELELGVVPPSREVTIYIQYIRTIAPSLGAKVGGLEVAAVLGELRAGNVIDAIVLECIRIYNSSYASRIGGVIRVVDVVVLSKEFVKVAVILG